MFRWLKKKRCQHRKGFGDPWPTNMIEIARFSPFEHDTIGYGISECAECGKRMFSCITLHAMGPRAEQMVDAFIGYKISTDEFLAFMTEKMAWIKFSLAKLEQNT